MQTPTKSVWKMKREREKSHTQMHKTSKMYWSADSWRQTNWKVWLKVKQHVKKSIGTIDRGTDNMRACTRNQSKQQATVQTIQNENKYKSLYINSIYMHSAQRPIWMSTGIAQFRAHLSCPLSCNCKRKQQTNTSIKWRRKEWKQGTDQLNHTHLAVSTNDFIDPQCTHKTQHKYNKFIDSNVSKFVWKLQNNQLIIRVFFGLRVIA